MDAEQLQAQLDAIYASTSWKMTAPFRWAMHLLKRGRNFIFLLKKKKKSSNTNQANTIIKQYLTPEAQNIIREFQSINQKK